MLRQLNELTCFRPQIMQKRTIEWGTTANGNTYAKGYYGSYKSACRNFFEWQGKHIIATCGRQCLLTHQWYGSVRKAHVSWSYLVDVLAKWLVGRQHRVDLQSDCDCVSISTLRLFLSSTRLAWMCSGPRDHEVLHERSLYLRAQVQELIHIYIIKPLSTSYL